MGDLTTELERSLGKLVREKYMTDFFILHRYPLAVRSTVLAPAVAVARLASPCTPLFRDAVPPVLCRPLLLLLRHVFQRCQRVARRRLLQLPTTSSEQPCQTVM